MTQQLKSLNAGFKHGMQEKLRQAFKAGYDCRPMLYGLTEKELEETFQRWLKRTK